MNIFSAWHIWATISLCKRKRNNEREKINECSLRKWENKIINHDEFEKPFYTTEKMICGEREWQENEARNKSRVFTFINNFISASAAIFKIETRQIFKHFVQCLLLIFVTLANSKNLMSTKLANFIPLEYIILSNPAQLAGWIISHPFQLKLANFRINSNSIIISWENKKEKQITWSQYWSFIVVIWWEPRSRKCFDWFV